MTNRLEDADLSLNASIGTYDVFISHQGIDMKRGFASHVYHGLRERGIGAFLDMEELPEGDDVRPIMLDAVRRAAIQVPIFTKTFAESVWCLVELFEMMESTKRNSKVIPVFYDVKSEDLTKEDGPFAKAIQAHRIKGNLNEDTIQGWEHALNEASWLGGFWLENYNKREGALKTCLVQKIEQEINDRIRLEVERNLVDLEGKVDNMVKLFRLKEERNVFLLLLWGMGGIGKTVLAQAIFYRLGKEFQVKSFVKDCAEGADKIQQSLLNDLLLRKNFPGDLGAGKTCLREGLRAKVLIVLDDTKNFKSIEEAIDLKSLHTGSLILVTSRIRTVFPDGTYLSDVFKGERYEVQGMNDDESLRLLCLRAFKEPFPETDLQVLAERVSHACGGLPLSLDVVNCDLSRTKKKKLWEDAIENLRSNQYQEIENSLMISYEALNDSAKEMFLDVACLLIDEDNRCAKYFWDGSSSVTAWRSALNSLVDGCLVKVCKKKRRDKDYEEYKCLTMHDQLRDLGRAIVKNEYEKSGKWSWVWRDTKISIAMGL